MHKAVRQAALSQAEYVCEQRGPLAPDDARRCVAAVAAEAVRRWEQAHPGQ